MDTGNLKEHLNLLKIKDIKNLIRQYNLHYKIKLSQKKPELISDLLKHFEDTINDNNITSKNYDITVPKIEEPKPKAPRKPRIKKDKKEEMLMQLMKRNKDSDDKFEQEDKLIRQLIKEQDAMKKEDKEVILKRLMKRNKDSDDKFEQDDKLIRQLIKEQDAMKKDKIKQPEDDFDAISQKLQQLIVVTPIKDIQKALLKLNFKGRMQTNKILLSMQLLQNFNTIEKMKNLISSLNIKNN